MEQLNQLKITALEAEVEFCENEIIVDVIIDKMHHDVGYGCKIFIPNTVEVPTELVGLLSVGVLLCFAGLCSPKQVILPLFSYDKIALGHLQKIFQLVSDARIMAVYGKDELVNNKLMLMSDSSNTKFTRSALYTHRDCHKVLQLCSGGLDSFCSILKLLEQGKSLDLLHVSGINIFNTQNELKATQKIASLLGVTLETVKIEWLGLKEFGIAFNSDKYSNWPQYNAVPFGRDLILIVLGSWFSKNTHAKSIGIANDLESWKVIPVPTTRRPDEFAVRNELASGLAYESLLCFLHHFIDPQLELISPLTTITKYAMVDFLAKNHGAFIKELSSCFWDNWCGECNKCLLYGLLFAQYETIDVPFKKDPLELYGLQKLPDEVILQAIDMFNQVVPD